MPRYFLHVSDGTKTILDPEGDELADDAAARELALATLSDVRRLPQSYDPAAWKRRLLACVDETGREVLTLPFFGAPALA
jgi:hypothetical protein